MQKFFEELYKTKLTKNRENNEMSYSLGDEQLEKGLGLNISVPTLSSSDAELKLFATNIYLYGILGYRLEEFTAVPAGFLCSFQKPEKSVNGKVQKAENCTVLISEGTVSEYRKKFSELFKAESELEDLSSDHSRFFLELSKMLEDENFYGYEELLARFISSELKNNPKLSGQTLEDGTVINPLPDGTTLNSRIENAISAIDSKGENSVNQRNCDDNQVLLERIARNIHLQAGEEVPSDEQIKIEGEVILKEVLLPKYREYISGESDILTSSDLIAEFAKIFQSRGSAVLALNICSTDFSADKVAEIVKDIANSEEPLKTSEKRSYERDHKQDTKKNEARKTLNKMRSSYFDETLFTPTENLK